MMKTQKREKIAVKITKHIVLGILLVFVVLIVVITINTCGDLAKREQEKLTLLAGENASIVRELMETMLNKQEVLVNAVESMRGTESGQKIAIMEDMITRTKLVEKNALSVFFIAEPNTFVETSPNGYAIFATDTATHSEPDMFKYINKELYETAKNDKKMTIIDPFNKTIDGKEYRVIAVLQPILNEEGELVGMIGSNIDTEVLNGANYNNGGFDTFLTQIICGHQTVITNSKNPEWIGRNYAEVGESTNIQKILDSTSNPVSFSFLDTNTDGKKYYKSYVPFYVKGSSVVWLSETSIAKSEFDVQIVKQAGFISIWLLIGLIVLTVLTYYRINRLLGPIKTLEQAVKGFSEGNLQNQIDFTSNDELGSLAESVRKSTKTLFAYISDIDRAMGEMANGNFNVTPSQPFIGDFKTIEDSITRFLVTISHTLRQMDMVADQVSSNSTQMSDGAQLLAQGATEQTISIEELAASISEISNHVQENAKNTKLAEEIAQSATVAVTNSNMHMQNLMAAMTDINTKSAEISKIIKTIEDIAFQTNVLALNAAVEAARAGTSRERICGSC